MLDFTLEKGLVLLLLGTHNKFTVIAFIVEPNTQAFGVIYLI